jgi:hypothetical protein
MSALDRASVTDKASGAETVDLQKGPGVTPNLSIRLQSDTSERWIAAGMTAQTKGCNFIHGEASCRGERVSPLAL